jgi:transcriptional regulator
MYTPRHYEEQDPERLLALMRRYGFATLVTAGEDGVPFATHLPLLAGRGEDGTVRLTGHMARANPQWRSFAEARDVLAIFHGPHGYVSPTWYTRAPEVPTWNYAVVHAYGRARILESPDAVLDVLRASAALYEAGNPEPWKPERAGEFVHRLMSGIVAFELRVTRLEGKAKLSQNKDAENRRSVISHLEQSPYAGDRELAELMRSREE